MGEVCAVLVPVATTPVPVPVAVADTVELLNGLTYGMETVTTAAAAIGAGAEVAATAAVVAGVEAAGLEAANVANVLLDVEEEEEEDDEEPEEGVPAGQSEPASDGGVQGMISKKTGEHWAPRLAS